MEGLTQQIRIAKDRTTVEDTLSILGAEFPDWTARGKWRPATCPFHDDKDIQHPSAYFLDEVEPDGSRSAWFKCYRDGCQVEGDQIDILWKGDIVSDRQEAVVWLATTFQFDLDGGGVARVTPLHQPRRQLPSPPAEFTYRGGLPDGWWEHGEPALEDWRAPWPRHWMDNPLSFTENERRFVINRWLPAARSYLRKSGRFRRVLDEQRREVPEEKIDHTLRAIIWECLTRFDLKKGSLFETYLRSAISHFSERVRMKSRSKKLGRPFRDINDPDEQIKLPSYDPTPGWIFAIYNRHCRAAVVKHPDLGPAFLRLADDHGFLGYTLVQHAKREGITPRMAKNRKRRLREFLIDFERDEPTAMSKRYSYGQKEAS